MLIPGATQVFADVLEGKNGAKGSGDVKKLFKNMEQGKYTLQDIVKVLESLDDAIDEDKLAQALALPNANLRELNTAWQRFLIEINEAGFADLMSNVLMSLTKMFNKFSNYIRDNKEDVKKWLDRVSAVLTYVIENFKLLIELWGLWKIGQWGMAIVASLTAVDGALALTRGQLVKTGLVFSGLFLLIGAFTLAVVDLYDTFQGENSIFKYMTEDKDKGLLGWLATVARAVFEITASILDMGVNLAAIGWGKVTGNKELQSFAEERAIDNGQRLFTRLQDMSLFPSNETLVKSMNPNWVQEQASKNNGKVTVPFTGAQYQVQPAPVPIQITVNGGADTSEQVAQVVGFKVQEILNGHYLQAASNYSPLIQRN